MKFLAVAVFFVAVAYASAIGIGLPLATSRGALEGALGGQWIPDVPAAGVPLPAPLAVSPLLAPQAAYYGARSIVAPGLPLGWGAPVVASRGDLEGALGGQWVPDVLPGH